MTFALLLVGFTGVLAVKIYLFLELFAHSMTSSQESYELGTSESSEKYLQTAPA